MRVPHAKTIFLSDKIHDLPFSKGLLAKSFTAVGLSPAKAFVIAQQIQDELRSRDETMITLGRLREIAVDALERHAGGEYARRYRKMEELARLDKPLIVMIGGTTGVGKSTIATEIAHRLGITRIVSTDSIREVMRGIFSKELMPAVYESAFNAWRGLRVPVPQGANPVIVGFREQTAVVATGVKSLIDRSVLEGESLVLEGIHLVPGYIKPSQFAGAFVVQIVIVVDDEDAHRSHFYIREIQTDGTRPFERYRANFGNIRLLGRYIEDLANEQGTPVLHSHELDRTVADVIEHIVDAVIGEG
ncbi:MAG: 2-phosphoglycerate kinase [Coriobacteriia bacterium]|nr:2-phosphoglycerate kinase [Coriobacteriia bacterium]